MSTKEARKNSCSKVNRFPTVDRCTQIEKSNRILLQKLASILKVKDSMIVPISKERSFNTSLRRQEVVKLERKNRAVQLRSKNKNKEWNDDYKVQAKVRRRDEQPYRSLNVSNDPIRLPRLNKKLDRERRSDQERSKCKM
eukprot:TRINITY_DN8409_c0_g3_i5.p1 TRINITY_DN8409_c0_g3~~TRINITY_DN8409_c0_g3_i5.p1  ORF type:complete len:140 (+),score=24.38 TRINITY_DN8409_c0_g3_i5:289-708(+)